MKDLDYNIKHTTKRILNLINYMDTLFSADDTVDVETETNDAIDLLKDDLKFRWDLTIENDLTQKYNLPIKVLRDINQGRKFQNYGEYIYPIRQKNIRNNNNFTYDIVVKILFDLRYTSLPATKLAEKYNVHRNTITAINAGQTYRIKDYDYPARN